MARKPRIYFPGAFYHVMLRGNNGNPLFFDEEDRLTFLNLLRECINRFDFRLHAFCLMTNHVHLAIQVGEIPLAKIIQNLSFRYARILNKKRDTIGHLFQGRYKAILVDAENYLLQLIRYIHLNPLRAKLILNLEDYEWSSHKAYLGLISMDWLTTNYILEYFSDRDIQARVKYERFIKEKFRDEEKINFDISNQKSFPVIGDDAFMKKIHQLQEYRLPKTRLIFDFIIDQVCAFYQIEKSKLHDQTRCRLSAKTRAVIAWIAREYKVQTPTQVAVYFNREPSTVSRLMNKMSQMSVTIHELNCIKQALIKANTQA